MLAAHQPVRQTLCPIRTPMQKMNFQLRLDYQMQTSPK